MLLISRSKITIQHLLERQYCRLSCRTATMSASSPPIIYTATVTAPTNIACIKYWGKASVEYNTPINDSVSITLDQADLRAVTTAAASASFDSDKLWLNGVEEVGAGTSKRFRACVDQIRKLATDKVDAATGKDLVSKDQWQTMKVHISSYNTFPTAAGLASSAAGYAALVFALVQLYGAKEEFEGQFSSIARQGSGSACRSLYGGFVAWRMGGLREDATDSIAQQIATEDHWPEIRALILVVSDAKKGTSSTTGMGTSVATSELLQHRATSVVPKRMESITRAYLNKDFESFGKITMRDSNQFHATCLDTYPPIFYMNDVSKSIIRIVHVYNEWAGEIRMAYTFDAGPNAVLYTLAKYQTEACALLLRYFPGSSEDYVSNRDVKDASMAFELSPDLIEAVDTSTGHSPMEREVKMIYCTKSGPGPQVLPESESLIDPITGLNTYSR
jgi:diphosphomevalonate decarboxylase